VHESWMWFSSSPAQLQEIRGFLRLP
jgi:hypothetical protein